LFHFAVESSWKHALPAAALFSSNSGKKWLRLRPPPLSLYCLLATKLFRFMLANKFVNHQARKGRAGSPPAAVFQQNSSPVIADFGSGERQPASAAG
jgi:hypothetical protein